MSQIKYTLTDLPVLLQLVTSKMGSKMPMLDWKHEPLSESFKSFKARLNFADQEITNYTEQATKLQLVVGDEGMQCILSSDLSDDDKNDS